MTEIPKDNNRWFDDQADDIFAKLIEKDIPSSFVRAVENFEVINYMRQSAIEEFVCALSRGEPFTDSALIDLEEEVEAFRAVVDVVMRETDPLDTRLRVIAGLAASTFRERAKHHNSLLEHSPIPLQPWELSDIKNDFLKVTASDPNARGRDFVDGITDLYREGITNDTQTLEYNIDYMFGTSITLTPNGEE